MAELSTGESRRESPFHQSNRSNIRPDTSSGTGGSAITLSFLYSPTPTPAPDAPKPGEAAGEVAKARRRTARTAPPLGSGHKFASGSSRPSWRKRDVSSAWRPLESIGRVSNGELDKRRIAREEACQLHKFAYVPRLAPIVRAIKIPNMLRAFHVHRTTRRPSSYKPLFKLLSVSPMYRATLFLGYTPPFGSVLALGSLILARAVPFDAFLGAAIYPFVFNVFVLEGAL